jgi:hypothetical protein
MSCFFNFPMRGVSDDISERAKERASNANRVRLGVRRDRFHQVPGEPLEGGILNLQLDDFCGAPVPRAAGTLRLHKGHPLLSVGYQRLVSILSRFQSRFARTSPRQAYWAIKRKIDVDSATRCLIAEMLNPNLEGVSRICNGKESCFRFKALVQVVIGNWRISLARAICGSASNARRRSLPPTIDNYCPPLAGVRESRCAKKHQARELRNRKGKRGEQVARSTIAKKGGRKK